MKKNGLELETWEFGLWTRVSYRWLCVGRGDNMVGWRKLTQMGQAGSLWLQAPPRLSIPLTHNSPIPPYSMANPEPDDMSP